MMKLALSLGILGLGLVLSTNSAFAQKTARNTIDCALTIHEYVSDDGDGYSLGQSRILARHQLNPENNVASGSYPPISYVVRLQADRSIKATLNVKLDQYSDRSERTSVDEVQTEVEDIYSNFKDRYVLECKSRR